MILLVSHYLTDGLLLGWQLKGFGVYANAALVGSEKTAV